jgi:Mg-chelatase subunit ChlD
MKKKILPYILMFIAFSLCGMLFAFAWNKFVSNRRAEPSQTAHPAPDLEQAHRTHKAPARPVTEPTTSAPHTAVEQSVSPAHPAPAVLPTPAALPAAPADAGPGCDIVLLMDSSGSMKRTDPANYRKNAAKLFLSLLGKSDRIGVISFGDSATLIIPLMQNTDLNRKALFGAVEKITSKEMFTNITEAVQKGFDELKKSQQRNRIMIMMSDGKIDLGSREKDDAARRALSDILLELARAKIQLYTVAFTEESDAVLLEQLARETSGFFRFAKTDKDVHIMFSSIFEKIKSPDALPFDGQSFMIDADIREAVLLVTKEPSTAITILDPSGRSNTASQHDGAMEWFVSAVFDMVSIKEPAVGTWSVKLSTNEGNRVYVLTNLSLKSSFDGSNGMQGQPMMIDVWLEKQGGIVTEKNILETTVFSADISGPGGKTIAVRLLPMETSGGAQPHSGRYTGTLTLDEAGEYSARLLAQGKTFKREKTILFRVAEQPVGRNKVPPSAQGAPSLEDGVSWAKVLTRFGIVNLAVIGLAVAVVGIRRLLVKMRSKR